jgi:hypothetical protein
MTKGDAEILAGLLDQYAATIRKTAQHAGTPTSPKFPCAGVARRIELPTCCVALDTVLILNRSAAHA